MSNPKPGPPAKPVAPAAPAAVTTEDVAALTGAPAVAKTEPVKRRRIVVSQGTFEDLARLRKVTDPGTGYELRVNAAGKVAAYDRATGEPADVEVVCPPIP